MRERAEEHLFNAQLLRDVVLLGLADGFRPLFHEECASSR